MNAIEELRKSLQEVIGDICNADDQSDITIWGRNNFTIKDMNEIGIRAWGKG